MGSYRRFGAMEEELDGVAGGGDLAPNMPWQQPQPYSLVVACLVQIEVASGLDRRFDVVEKELDGITGGGD
ncbi:hypothetical protein ACLB2K_031856 [Fragaria x ananassa]